MPVWTQRELPGDSAGVWSGRSRMWNGTTLNAWETWKGGFCDDPSGSIGHVTAGDFNGDGKLDILCVPTQAVAVG